MAIRWQDLKDFLRSAGGAVLRAEVAVGADGRSRGYGCATFQTADGAQHAMRALHDTELSGRVVVVRPDKAALRHAQLSAVGGRRVFVGNLTWDARQVVRGRICKVEARGPELL